MSRYFTTFSRITRLNISSNLSLEKKVLANKFSGGYHNQAAFEESAGRRSAGGPEESAPRGREAPSGNFLRKLRKKFLTGKREAGNISPCASRRRAGAGRGRKAPPGTLRTGYCGQKKTDKRKPDGPRRREAAKSILFFQQRSNAALRGRSERRV